MRIAFYGISDITIETATKFIDNGHDVIIIDPDKEHIEELSEDLDCGFLIGNASYPKIMQEINPEKTDFFFALSEDNQANIVACLVARSLGVNRNILRVDDPSFQSICEELGLNEVIITAKVTSQYLFDLILNENVLKLFNYIKDKIFLQLITVDKDPSKIEIPSEARIICYFRNGAFNHVSESTTFKEGDELIVLCDLDHKKKVLEKLNHQEDSNNS